MGFDCPSSSSSQTYGFWLSFFKSFSNLWLLIVLFQVLLKLMASDCPFCKSFSNLWLLSVPSQVLLKLMASACCVWSPSQAYGIWLSLLQSFSNLWLLIVPCQVFLKPMASDCPLSSPSQAYGCWLILSVYIIMSFDFPFIRLFGVR